MAAVRKASRKLNKQTVQDEFYVKRNKVLRELLDESEVQENDLWSFVDAGSHLVIVRRREIMEIFPDEPEEEEQVTPALDEPIVEEVIPNEEV